MNWQKVFYTAGIFIGLAVCSVSAQSDGTAWPSSDALNRQVETSETLGPIRENKKVGIFYFLWHREGPECRADWSDGPYDVTKILANLPEAEQKDNERSRSPFWGPQGTSYYWGEPLFGYYGLRDPWVLRRHMILLADAGVDFLVFDTTNAATYPDVFIPLCEMLKTLRAEGEKTPQITFMLNTEAGKTADKLWDEIYGTGRFDDLLFQLDGKPLLIGDPEQITNETIREKLTLRRAHWPTEMVNTQNAWHWEAAYPQPYGWSVSEDQPEQVNVSVAQNLRRFPDAAVADMSGGYARGRSFHQGILEENLAADEGRNFAEQWERAYELDPPYVMVTGWNEWIAGRWPRDGGDRMVFVDQYNQEYSRDIEPMKGGHLDNYYLQMIEGIRKYKGVTALPAAAEKQTIDLDAGFDQWADITPELTDHQNETLSRDFDGSGGMHYTNNTGRNDIRTVKAVRDDERFYFYVKTAETIADHALDGLTILIDTDNDLTTGFIGGDVLIGQAYNSKIAAFAVHTGESDQWTWETAGEVPYKRADNEIMWAVDYTALGLTAETASFDRISFKIIDHFGVEAAPGDLYTTGDTAPESRFFYRLKESCGK